MVSGGPIIVKLRCTPRHSGLDQVVDGGLRDRWGADVETLEGFGDGKAPACHVLAPKVSMAVSSKVCAGGSSKFVVIQGNRAIYSEVRELRRSDARNSPRYAGGFRLSKRSRSTARSV